MAQYGVLEAANVWIGSWAYGCDPRALALFLDDEVVEDQEERKDAEGTTVLRDRSYYVSTVRKIRDRLQLLSVQRFDALEVFQEWDKVSDEGPLEDVWVAATRERLVGRLFDNPASETLQRGVSDSRCDWLLWLRFFVDRLGDDDSVTLSLEAVWGDDPEDELVRTPTLCADTRAELRGEIAGVLPTIVLTEGSSDAAALTAAVRFVRPHLEGFMTFMDYSTKASGGVDAVVRGLKALAAAGVANRVIGLLDNDTAGREGFEILTAARLPSRFTPLLLPHSDVAVAYPTYGTEGLVEKDLNGIAVSIEMFLGREVLTDSSGALTPVQLTGYNRRMGTYQGELEAKGEVKSRFFAKADRAASAGAVASEWSELGELLDYLVAQS